jgi:predicted dithiol-disulfide oxidoreductase (DUF899 family)
MSHPKIVSQAEWLNARKALLAKEKSFTRERDALSVARRDLPAVKVEKAYAFDGPSGKKTLADLFGGKRQLVTYHFMFDPSWSEGCKSCSFIAESFDGMVPHLAARDVSFVAISRAPLPKLLAFQERMGWAFPWFSSAETDFNHDYGVTFGPEDRTDGKASYNYGSTDFSQSEAPGLSVFLHEEGSGSVLHTYSTYGRGLDMLISAYNYLDLTPLGRQEAGLPYGMAWLRHHDKYAGA